MVVVAIRASHEEDARPAVSGLRAMYRQISAAKAATAASWPIRRLRVWVTSSRMASSYGRERVDMKCVFLGKGVMGVWLALLT